MAYDKSAVRKILDQAKAAGRGALTAPEAKGICEAYGIAVPSEAVAGTATDAAKLATKIGYPVVMKIVSPQILHKTEAGGVVVGVKSAEAAQQAFATIVDNARRYDAKASIDSASSRVAGASRNVMSFNTSTRMPPRPKATSLPKAGSVTAPMSTSWPPESICWTCTPSMVAFGS